MKYLLLSLMVLAALLAIPYFSPNPGNTMRRSIAGEDTPPPRPAPAFAHLTCSPTGTCQACTTCSSCRHCNSSPDNHCSVCR